MAFDLFNDNLKNRYVYIPLLLTISDAEKVKTRGGQSAIRSAKCNLRNCGSCISLKFFILKHCRSCVADKSV